MKKLLTICSALMLLFSCSKVSKVTVIDTFDKEIISEIQPKKDGNYSVNGASAHGHFDHY